MSTWTKVAAGLLAIFVSGYAASLVVGWFGLVYVLLAATIGVVVQLAVHGAAGIGLAFVFGFGFLAPAPVFFDPPLAGSPLMSLLLLLFYAAIIAAIGAAIVAVLRGDFRPLRHHGP